MEQSVVMSGRRAVVGFGVVAALAIGVFAALGPEAETAAAAMSAQAGTAETDVNGRLAKLEERTQQAEARVARLQDDARRLDSALKKSDETVATLSKQVKTLTDTQERFARAISVESSGAVRITGNLRLENNVLEDISVVPCDAAAAAQKRQCTCPEGLIAVGIELRPLAVSAYPGPATYNTSLVCGRL